MIDMPATPTPHDQPPQEPQASWISFTSLYQQVSTLFSPPPRPRAIRRALRRAGVPLCRPTTTSEHGSPATLYYERAAAEKWLATASAKAL